MIPPLASWLNPFARPRAAARPARRTPPLAAGLRRRLAAHDPETVRHCDRVAAYAVVLGRALGLTPQALWRLRRAAKLHDVGKVAVPAALLNKPAALTAAEFAVVRGHAGYGVELLAARGAPAAVVAVVRSHHERWDGRGYPDATPGAVTPLVARIVAVADAFDAMTADRPYRRGLPAGEAFGRLAAGAGSQFDPRLVRAFAAARPAVERVLRAAAGR